jgi:hypothetical protein
MGLQVRLTDPGRGTWIIDDDTGNGRRLEPLPPAGEMEVCARCHSRRSQLYDDYRFGRPLLDTHRLALLDEELYYADGQILEEVYVHGSFLQSKMFRKGVTCSDCHDAHALTLHFPGNKVCFRCHLASKYETSSHHFHKPETPGAFCVDCHMPPKDYMVVDPRHDHSLRNPRPDLTLELGTPNACNDCHKDKSTQWSLDYVVKWYGPDRKSSGPHYGHALEAGRSGSVEAEIALVKLAEDAEAPVIARATALSLLSDYLTRSSLEAVRRFLTAEDPLLRFAAVRAIESADPETRLAMAQPLLLDSVRAVRLEATRVLAPVPSAQWNRKRRSHLEAGIAEYRASQYVNGDRAGSHLNLGWLDTQLGQLQQAEQAYRKAIDMDPSFAPAYVNLADLYRVQRRDDRGERTLRQALEAFGRGERGRRPGAGGCPHEASGRQRDSARVGDDLPRKRLTPGGPELRQEVARSGSGRRESSPAPERVGGA